MRIIKGKRTWDLVNSYCMGINSYKPMEIDTAKITGWGKIFNDSIKDGDVLWIKTKSGIGELLVNSIRYENSDRTIWSANVTLGERVEE